MKVTVSGVDVQDFIKRFFFLLYEASPVLGMGVLQQVSGATENDVMDCILGAYDYGGINIHRNVYADYVYGRMVKQGVKDVTKDGFTITTDVFNPEYQGFAKKYPTNDAVLDAVCKSFGGSCQWSGSWMDKGK